MVFQVHLVPWEKQLTPKRVIAVLMDYRVRLDHQDLLVSPEKKVSSVKKVFLEKRHTVHVALMVYLVELDILVFLVLLVISENRVYQAYPEILIYLDFKDTVRLAHKVIQVGLVFLVYLVFQEPLDTKVMLVNLAVVDSAHLLSLVLKVTVVHKVIVVDQG